MRHARGVGTNSPNGTALTDGNVVCLFVRNDEDNPTLQIADEFVVATGGTGQTSYTNGQLLIGNSTGNTLEKANWHKNFLIWPKT